MSRTTIFAVQVYGTDQGEVEATWATIQKERGW